MSYRVYETRDGSHFAGRSSPDGNHSVFRLGYLLLLPFTLAAIVMAAMTLPICCLWDRWRGREE